MSIRWTVCLLLENKRALFLAGRLHKKWHAVSSLQQSRVFTEISAWKFFFQIEATCKWRKGPFFVLKSIFVKDLLEFTGQRAKTPKHTSNWHIWDTLRRIGSGNTGKERKKKLLLLIRGHLGVSHLSTLEYSTQKFNHTWELNGEGVPLKLSNF